LEAGKEPKPKVPFQPRLDYDRGVPVYRQIFDAVLLALSRGELRTEEQLPTIHDLARALQVNPNTVARAYRELEQAGFVVAARGRGTFPAKRARPPEPKRQSLLKAIVERALGDCARHGLGKDDLLEYLRRQTA
jgi:GntR family transcriptional regulator